MRPNAALGTSVRGRSVSRGLCSCDAAIGVQMNPEGFAVRQPVPIRKLRPGGEALQEALVANQGEAALAARQQPLLEPPDPSGGPILVVGKRARWPPLLLQFVPPAPSAALCSNR